MSFRITGLDPAPFRDLWGQSDAALAARGVRRVAVDATPGFPDRIEMRDMVPGEVALLLNYEHLPVATPYRSRHAIYVRDGAEARYDAQDTVPDVMLRRTLAIRAFDRDGTMVDAGIAAGAEIEPLIRRLLDDRRADYLHAHFAARGCYAGRIDRV